MASKKEARKARVAWNQAIREGRIVSFPNDGRMIETLTPGQAKAMVTRSTADGISCHIVDPALAEPEAHP
jgi:hypothetical protein